MFGNSHMPLYTSEESRLSKVKCSHRPVLGYSFVTSGYLPMISTSSGALMLCFKPRRDLSQVSTCYKASAAEVE